MTLQDVQRLRQQTSDDSIFNQLYSSDQEFKKKVENVRSANPNMTPFEKLKFPSVMIDIHYGTNRGTNMDQTGDMLNTAMKKPEGNTAWETLTKDPLIFAGQTAKNILPSTGRLIGGVASMVRHPIETGKSLIELGTGGVANTIETIADLAGVKNAEEIFNLESEDTAKAVGDFYVQRYGSLEKAATTLRDDPAGFLSDLGAVVSGVGGLVRGGATALGSVTGAATKTSTTLGGLGRGIRAAQSVGGSLIKTGIDMEPLVITGRGVVLAGRGVRSAVAAGAKGILPEVMVTKALKVNPSDIRAFQNLPGNELPGDFLIRKGILSGGGMALGEGGVEMTGVSPVGRTRVGIMDDLERIKNKSIRTVNDSLSTVKQTYDVLDDVPTEVPKLMDEILTIANKYDLKEPREFINSLIGKERVTLTELNQLKRTAYDMFNTYKRSNLADDSFRAQQIIGYEQKLRAFIESEASKKGLPDIAILNEDWQKSNEILDAMYNADAASWSKGKLTFGLMDGMFALGTFGITQDFFATAGVVVARKVIESTLFKTTFAKYLNRLDPRNIEILTKAFKSMRHTKESSQMLRKVVAQTAEDIKNKRIAEVEDVSHQMTPSQPSRTVTPPESGMSPQSPTLPPPAPAVKETVPKSPKKK